MPFYYIPPPTEELIACGRLGTWPARLEGVVLNVVRVVCAYKTLSIG